MTKQTLAAAAIVATAAAQTPDAQPPAPADLFADLTADPTAVVEMSHGEKEALRSVNSGANQFAGALELMAAGAGGGPEGAAGFYRLAAAKIRELAQKTRNVAMNHAVALAKADKQ